MLKTSRVPAVVATIALSFGSLTVASAASAAKPPTEPCAKQSAQVQKAEDALERVNAVFVKRQVKVKKAKVRVEKADRRNERAKAKKALVEARKLRATAAKTKKAQVQRLAKAQKRLADCEATQTPVD